MHEQKLQEKYILFQLLNQNMESLKQQQQMVQHQMLETKSTMTSIDDLFNTKEGTDVFIPVGSGCFGKGTVVDKNKILVNIGSGLFMNKKTGDSKTLLEKRMKDIEKASEELNLHIERVTKQLNEMGAEIQQLTQKQSKS